MPRKKTGKQGKQFRETNAEWQWLKKYRVWDANRKIFLYPENWIEPELRLSPASSAALRKVVAFVCEECGKGTKRARTRKPARRSVRVLLAGKNRISALVAAQTLASDLGKNLYRVDLGAVVSKYIGETEKNLSSVFDAAKKSEAVLFFDEADALFGKRTDVKDSHDRYANIQGLVQRIEEHKGLAILATGKRANIDEAFLRRLRFVISVSPQKKAARGKSSAR